MKSRILKFMGVFALAVVLVITIGTVFADEAEDSVEPRTLISTEYEVIDNDYFTADDTLSLSKIIIDGNAFVAGKDVTLSFYCRTICVSRKNYSKEYLWRWTRC